MAVLNRLFQESLHRLNQIKAGRDFPVSGSRDRFLKNFMRCILHPLILTHAQVSPDRSSRRRSPFTVAGGPIISVTVHWFHFVLVNFDQNIGAALKDCQAAEDWDALHFEEPLIRYRE